jgi:cell division protein FtsI/penicillin-binding protein 2
VIRSPVVELRKRMKISFIIFLLWSGMIFFKLADLQIFRHKIYKKIIAAQNSRIVSVDSKRGDIFDRNEKILATSVRASSIYIDPSQWEGRENELKRLCNSLNLSEEVYESIIKSINSRKQFQWVKRKISFEEEELIETLGMDKVGIIKEFKRIYPEGELASHLLGGVGVDEQGLEGIEKYYDPILSGNKGKICIYRDGKRVPQPYYIQEIVPPKSGKDLVLTIDKFIQFLTDEVLEIWVKKWDAKGGVAIVMDPKNGEILALSSYPRYDTNHYCKTNEESKLNRAIRWLYEPGSTLKVSIASTVFESGRVNFNEVFDCRGGKIELYNVSIKDHKNFSFLSFPEIIKYSSNVGAIKIALRMKEDEIFNSLNNKFKFSQRTGIDLPGEEKGILRHPSQWSGISLGSIAIGQEIAATPLQVLRAVSSIANNGFIVYPHLLKKVKDGEREESIIYKPPERIISEKTSKTIKRIMEMVVEEGTGKKAKIEGLRVAGKTGTSQKFVNGKYSDTFYISSFVGFFPSDEPKYSIIVVIDEPKGSYWGGEVAAPVFRDIAMGIIRLRDWEIVKDYHFASLREIENEDKRFTSKN